jgi:DNA-binding response OmpR family regulator
MLERVNLNARERISIALVESDAQLRISLRAVLHGAGFRSIVDFGSLERLKEYFDQEMPDLIIIDVHTPGGDACELVRNIRFSHKGGNPFLSVIMTLWQGKVDKLEKMINAGADHIVLKPLSPQTLIARIEALIERRKPFVATSCYIGPDRRKESRGEGAVPIFDVPNTLKEKALAKILDPSELQREIDRTMVSINGEMIHRLAFQLAFQAESLAYVISQEPAKTAETLNDYKVALLELMRRLDPKKEDQTNKTVKSLYGIHGRIEASSPNPDDVALLRKMSSAINIGLKNAETGDALMRQVREALEKAKRAQAKSAAGPLAFRAAI